ncbi:hypothetical protein L218DRAFT_1081675 [Marasmius fiardii PR-910]|nr:hypothetical protein L218DRAFT_1081675 [Marasmius fiardii PR-910]
MLPLELIIHVLSFFDAEDDREILKSCALVSSSWTPIVQAGLFRDLILKHTSPRHEDYFEISTQKIDAYNTLIEQIDRNPRLSTYIQYVSLNNFERLGRSMSMTCIQQEQREREAICNLLLKLTNVRSLRLFRCGFNDDFHEALFHIFGLPTLTRFEVIFARYTSMRDLLLIFSIAINLKEVNLVNIGFESRSLPSAQETLRIAAPQSIHLSNLLLNLIPLDHIVPFFSEPHCPIDFSSLRTLRLHRAKVFDYDMTAQLLCLVGHKLQHLELHGPDRVSEGKDNVHLGYTPNLQSLTLLNLRQTLNYNSVPWIESLFPIAIAQKGPIVPSLRTITFEIVADTPNLLLRGAGSAPWSPLKAVDALFSSNKSSLQLPLLERARVVVSTPNEVLDPDLACVVEAQFPELMKEGKLIFETKYWEMATSKALMVLGGGGGA